MKSYQVSLPTGEVIVKADSYRIASDQHLRLYREDEDGKSIEIGFYLANKYFGISEHFRNPVVAVA